MRYAIWVACVCSAVAFPASAADPLPAPLVTGLKHPTSVCVGPDGRVYVTTWDDIKKAATGTVIVIEKDQAVPFATGLDHPSAIVAFQQWFYVTDRQRVWRIDRKGKAEVFAAANAFPKPPKSLTGIEVDIETGTLFVSDFGKQGKDEAIYRIDSKGKVTLVTDEKKTPALEGPSGLVMDGQSHLLVVGVAGHVLRVKIATGAAEKVAEGLSLPEGLAWDKFGRLFINDPTGKIFAIPRPGEKPILIAQGFGVTGQICFDPIRNQILVPDIGAGTVTAISSKIPGWEVDDTPVPGIEAAVAFGDLQWTGWKPMTDAGKPNPLRPVFLTNPGDGSNRNFVCIQQGVIHVFSNDPKAKETKVFLDIQNKVRYSDNENEEGMLGLAFHPKFKENGQFFVFYTDKNAKLSNVVSRFKVSKDDPNKADPASEEVLLRFSKPFWNHDGGTLAFGPDGYLYITHGDGGSGNDPFGNGQNLKTLLGKVLRIDVDSKGEPEGVSPRRNYGIPKDNPFVARKDALPEIYAYGLRNIWRMAFDRKSGKLWASDVGQNLYEEIDIIEKGGNYGWNLREGLHPFGANGVGPRKDLIEPIWEYHHDIGKSLTGGLVYRGTKFPELDGHYIYSDYVTGRFGALKYDEEKKRVVANRPLKFPNVPVMSFGEDEKGEIYFMTYSPTGKGIYSLVKSDGGKGKN